MLRSQRRCKMWNRSSHYGQLGWCRIVIAICQLMSNQKPLTSYRITGGLFFVQKVVGHVIFNPRSEVGQSVLARRKGWVTYFPAATFLIAPAHTPPPPPPPPPPVLIDQSLNEYILKVVTSVVIIILLLSNFFRRPWAQSELHSRT